MRLFVEEGGGKRRLGALWRLLAQFAVFQVGVVVLGGLLTLGWLLVSSPGAVLGGGGLDFPALLLIGSVAALISTFLSVWLAGRFLDKRPFRDFGFHLDGGWWLDLGFGLVLGAALMTGIFLIELAFGWISVAGTFEALTPGAPFILAILLPLVTFLCVGIYEETLSRGYQLRNIAEGLNFPSIGPRGAVLLAWALSSTVFGLLHAFNPSASVLSTVNIAFAGLLLGVGYVLTGELAIPIGLHITWNFFQGNVFGFPVSGLDPIGATFITVEQGGPELWTGGVFGPEAGLLDPIAVLIGSLLIILWVRLRRGKAAIHTPLAQGPERSLVPGDSEGTG